MEHMKPGASMAVLLALAAGSNAQSEPPPAPPPEPLQHADAVISSLESGSRGYRQCIATAGNESSAQLRCLEQELVYQRGSVERISRKLEIELRRDSARRKAFSAQQRVWQQKSDRRCGPPGEAQLINLLCRFDHTITRWRELNYWLSNTSAQYQADDRPGANGTMKMRLGDVTFGVQTESCERHALAGALSCSGVRLEVSGAILRRQTISLEKLWLPDTGRSDVRAYTGFRGGLHTVFGEIRYGVVVSDINADGYEDLMIWTGLDGSRGGPSYTYYLYNPKTRRLAESIRLGAMMKGYSLLRIVDGELFAWTSSGRCGRGEKVIEIRRMRFRIASRRDYTTC